MANDLYAKFEAGSAGLLLLQVLLPKRFDWKLWWHVQKTKYLLNCRVIDWLIDWLVVSALDVAEFSEFWETVCKKQEKGRFANLLIQKLVTQLTKKSTKAKKTEQYSSDGLCVTAQGLYAVLPVYKCWCLCAHTWFCSIYFQAAAYSTRDRADIWVWQQRRRQITKHHNVLSQDGAPE